MKTPIRILHLENDPADVALVQSALESGGISFSTTCVQSREDFVSALEKGNIDLVLSDFSLPAFNGLSAAELVRTKWPSIPLIMVSWTSGEELALDSVKNGATDYVFKGRISRLVPAVRRCMLEVDARSQRQQLEARLIESQKMEAVGQVAAGVAHDFNNILAVILGYTELVTSELSPDSPLHESMEEIRLASERASGLTRQLLVFSRKQTVKPIVLDLNEEVKDMEKMLRRVIHENIGMTIVCEEKFGRIKAAPGYVGQVLLNLVVNSRDAMPNGGELTIATENVFLDEDYIRQHPGATPGEHVMLSVRDTGTGMTAEVKNRLFEAFFTTKPSGKGTGLGLSTCRTIVQSSGGHIEIQSEVGIGTTFRVYFPRVQEDLDISAKPLQKGMLPRGTETILVVEDDPALRRLACQILERQGYKVLAALNGQDALRVVSQHKGEIISLVVTDVVMPVMGGKEMTERLKHNNSEIKILFTSGYVNRNDTAFQEPFEKGVDLISKPYTRQKLARKVREMLDAS